ncbi:hypothetical protein ACPFUV_002333, partial [Vibrio cholerae]
ASGLGPEGRGFESLFTDHSSKPQQMLRLFAFYLFKTHASSPSCPALTLSTDGRFFIITLLGIFLSSKLRSYRQFIDISLLIHLFTTMVTEVFSMAQ